jgi:TonB-linked SusC/RagA family outer membrane protein
LAKILNYLQDMQKLTAVLLQQMGELFAYLKNHEKGRHIMKVSACFITITVVTIQLLTASPGRGQDMNTSFITLGLNDETLPAAIARIEKLSGLRFAYPSDQVSKYNHISIARENRSVRATLDLVLAATPLKYKQVGNQVIIFSREMVVPDSLHQYEVFYEPMADTTITGVVRDGVTGEPIQHASVTVKGTRIGTTTNASGRFSLQLRSLNRNYILVISSVGYGGRQIAVDGNRSFEITMQKNEAKLDEIVVVGYGTTSKRNLTGTVGSITAEEIGKQPIGNPLAALPGRIAGALVQQNNGWMGSAIQIQIRGTNTLSSGAIPLYIIDGVPFTNFNGGSPATDNLNAFGTSGASGGISPFNSINPADIERIDILKDADATAIYGSRGANGVVLITTKKGKAGKTKLDVNINTGTSELARYIPMLNLQQYLQLRREAFKNDGVTPTAANAPDLLVWDTTKSTDWQKTLLGGTGRILDAQATLSGGEGRTRFLFNAAYRRETSVFPGDNTGKRFSTRLHVDHNSADNKFNASLGVSYSNDNTQIMTADISSAYNLPPNLPLYDANGKLFWNNNFTNPLANLLRRYKGITTNLIGNAVLRYTLLPGLNLKMNLGYAVNDLDQNTYTPASSQNPANNPVSSAQFTTNKAQNWIVEPTAEYTFNLGGGKLAVLAGGSWQHNTSNGQFLSGSNYSNEALLGTLSAAGTVTVSYNNIVEYKYAAAFGRINYDYKGKYIINITGRRDGSSRFGPNNRFGNFGAVGASWIFTEEDFAKNNLNFLSFGKLRASFGTTGNDQISNYLHLPLYTATTIYLGNPTIYPQTLPNANVQWETTRKLEFALELGFLKDRILLTANYYRNRSSNLISFIRVPTQSGYNSQTANLPALVQNSGLELELNTTNINSKYFRWTTTFNITLPKNKLIDFPGLANTFSASSYVIGQPINFTRAYHFLGVDPATGRALYEDIDKDGSVTFANDRIVMPIGTPYYGGMGNTFTYKNWQFDIFFQFNHRFGATSILSTPVGSLRNQNTSVLDRWKQAGDVTHLPGASTTAGAPIATSWGNYTSSDAVWGDASYLKLRSAALSYNLPANWIKRIRMNNLRAFVQGQNLFIWAKNKYIYDTETQITGGPSGLGTGTLGQVLPPLRTIVFGINCSF